MKIGILETGLLRDEFVGRFDPYPIMFERFIGLSGHTFEYESYCVLNGDMPSSIYACDGWLITGSRHGVYDALGWMAPLQEFIRELAVTEIPLIGVCFGHQIIAEALGGEVVKSDKGWGVGLCQYDVEQTYPWMKTELRQVGLYAFHQDQVVSCPTSAQVILSSKFCLYAGLSYGESIISVQAHPEFAAAYESALLDILGGTVIPEKVTQQANGTMSEGKGADTQQLACWFADFFLLQQETAQSGQHKLAR